MLSVTGRERLIDFAKLERRERMDIKEDKDRQVTMAQ
jgi:hypothetical protein